MSSNFASSWHKHTRRICNKHIYAAHHISSYVSYCTSKKLAIDMALVTRIA